jgi:hypothetical protein
MYGALIIVVLSPRCCTLFPERHSLLWRQVNNNEAVGARFERILNSLLLPICEQRVVITYMILGVNKKSNAGHITLPIRMTGAVRPLFLASLTIPKHVA